MPYILRRFPYFDLPTEWALPVEPGSFEVKASQAIVWFNLTRSIDFEPDPSLCYPAILDTGLSHNFSITARQLREWPGIEPGELVPIGASEVHIPGRKADHPLLITRYKARLWLYRNIPGEPRPALDSEPFDLQIPTGIAVYPDGFPGPRLPLLGLRGLQWRKLRLYINSEDRRISIRTPFPA